MEKIETYDAIIIGTGQAGKPLAIKLAKEGWKVAIIEERFVGGSCINYGCTPTKAMIASARAAHIISRSADFGIHTGAVKVNLDEVVSRKDKIVKLFRKSSEHSLESNKNVKLIFGSASFLSGNEILIKLKKGNVKKIKSENIFINTGTTPLIPEIEGLGEIEYFTSESLMNLKKIPEHLIIIGGGYIATEFGQMFRRFGSKVTMIEKSKRLLSSEDEDVSCEIEKILTEDGLKIFTSADIQNVKKTGKKNIRIKLNINSRNTNTSKRKIITGTHLLIAAGMKPSTENLEPDKAGIKTDDKGFIKVNDVLMTNIKGIYALGDVKGGPAFTQISYDDYKIVFYNLTRKPKAKIKTTKDRMVPYTVFIDPQLGRVGMNEKEAKGKGIKFKSAIFPMKYSARAIETGETRGFIKALVNKANGKIIGCAVLGPEGGEIMAMLEIAMIGSLKYTQLRDTIFSHPTFSENLNNLFLKFDL